MERVAALMGRKIYAHRRDGRNPHWKPIYTLALRGQRAAALMEQLHPLMGERRRRQIEEALSATREARAGIRPRRVLSKEQRNEITRRLDAGESAVTLAEEFRIARESVYRAARRERAA